MQVKIKTFDVDMEVKNNGLEFEVRSPDGKRQLGDLYLTKTKLIWCKGKTVRENGQEVKWEQFIQWMADSE